MGITVEVRKPKLTKMCKSNSNSNRKYSVQKWVALAAIVQ